jgi:hypothetical protein
MVRETFRRASRSAFIWGRPANAPQFISRNSTTTTANGAGIDYALTPWSADLPPGTTTQNIPVAIHDDSIAEPDEVAMVILRNPNNARLGAITQFALSVVDNDTPPSLPYAGFAAGNSTVSEGAGTATIPLSLSVPANGVVTVDYAITAGTASVADFTPATGTLTFNPGDSVQFVPVGYPRRCGHRILGNGVGDAFQSHRSAAWESQRPHACDHR